MFRNKAKYSRDTFLVELNKIDWTAINTLPDVNTMMQWLVQQVTDCLDRVAPIQSMSAVKKQQRMSKPWITDDIKVLSKRKRDAFQNFINTKSPAYHMQYRFINKDIPKQMTMITGSTTNQHWLCSDKTGLLDAKKQRRRCCYAGSLIKKTLNSERPGNSF